jgi:cell fate (sporulation/competence/biofilm development) regulator YmcA (YheA/YmcA/DUF963 family)
MNKLFQLGLLLIALSVNATTFKTYGKYSRAANNLVSKRALKEEPVAYDQLEHDLEDDRLNTEFEEWVFRAFEQLQIQTFEISTKLNECKIELESVKSLTNKTL